MRTAVLVLATAMNAAAMSSPAANEPPDALVKSTVSEVLTVIKETSDRNQLRRAAEQKVLPHFDFTRMTQLAVGAACRKATPDQQRRLEDNFRALLVNTYAASLARGARGNRAVEVAPLQGNTGNEVTVKTAVKESGKPPIDINYRMANGATGWKVYDVVVEGISLVTTYRDSFAAEVSKGGIEGLIKALDAKNQALAKG